MLTADELDELVKEYDLLWKAHCALLLAGMRLSVIVDFPARDKKDTRAFWRAVDDKFDRGYDRTVLTALRMNFLDGLKDNRAVRTALYAEAAADLLVARAEGRTAQPGRLDRSVTELHELVRTGLSDDRTLQRLEVDVSGPGEVPADTRQPLVTALVAAIKDSGADFGRRLADAIREAVAALPDEATNRIAGGVSGNAVQAAVIVGNITLPPLEP